MKIAIVTDSVADIPSEKVAEYNLTIIPSLVIIDGKEFQDGIDISREEFYTRLPTLQNPATTAAPPPSHFSQAYKKLFGAGYEHIVSIHVAANLSNIPNAAILAAKEFPEKVTVIDSTSLTLGIGFQVIAAAQVAKDDATVADVIAAAEHVRENMLVVAMIDTLDQLKRSGRVNWLTANIGSLLSVRMFIELKDGNLIRLGQVRTRNKAMVELTNRINQFGPISQLAMLHSNAEADARAVYKSLKLDMDDEPFFVNVTPSIGTHVGVNALGFTAVKAR